MSSRQVQSKQGPVDGQCLCGKVKVKVAQMAFRVGACHCQYCRTWTGGPLFTFDCGTEVKLDGACFISGFQSSDWAERGFCNNCGTHLFYRLKQNGQYFIPAGLLTLPDDPVLDHQIFIEQKPRWYCFANPTRELTGAEVFASFSSD